MKRLVMMIAVGCLALPAVGAARANDVDQQILGVWQLQCTTPDGAQRKPVVVVGRQYAQYMAWYVVKGELKPFKDVRLQGDRLVGSIVPPERPDITVTCEAWLKSPDQCTGTATYRARDGGDTGSWKFDGRRLALSEFDEAMKWKLTFVTPENEQYDATVTVVGKDNRFYAWYSDGDHELPARSLTIQADRVEMQLSGESPEGRHVDVRFRGTVTGDTVQGNAEYRLREDTGSFPFKARRDS
ncbi:MAG: hypothetical protein GXY58_09860 [Planctomycetaceae bacterium]|nr:hypothetical protein [Planctomycetaceae bacterium]